MGRQRRTRQELLEGIVSRYGGSEPSLTDEEAAEAWAELLADARVLLEQERRGVIERSTETILARCVTAAAAAEATGRMAPPDDDRCCLWCGTSGLTHDPRCPVECATD